MNNADNSSPSVRDVLDRHPLASKVILAIAALILALLIVLGAVMLVLAFFSVDQIDIRGDSPYSEEEILSVCGIKKGDRLYYLGADEGERALLEKYPYLKSVEIVAYFPNKAVIKLESFRRVFVAECEEGYCYLNGELKILETVSSDEEIDKGAIRLVLSEGVRGSVGEKAAFDGAKLVDKIYSALSDFEYFNEIGRMDVSDARSISFVFLGKYKIILGDTQSIPEKLSLALRIHGSDEFLKDSFAIIDVSNTKKAILRYVNEEDLSK